MKNIISIALMMAFAISTHAGTELLKNGSLSEWSSMTKLKSWDSRSLDKEMAVTVNDNPSAKLSGVNGQMATTIRLKKGTYYRIKGWIYKGGSSSYGCVGLRNKSFRWNIKLEGSKETGKWKEVSALYKADGTEKYFYCFNWYIGKQEACYYSSLSLEELTADEAKMELAKK